MKIILAPAQNPPWLSVHLCLSQTSGWAAGAGTGASPPMGEGRPKSELTFAPPGAPPEQVCLILQPQPPGEYQPRPL